MAGPVDFMSDHRISELRKAFEKVLGEQIAQAKANDTGYPHFLNGYCQAFNPRTDEPCGKPLYGTMQRIMRGGGPKVYCGSLTCPDYDLPKDPAPGITLRFVPSGGK